ncbi:amino acid ABC transporter permease [Faecalicatena contorta]|uniref:amino acid ABC transporter permease n=1 Tax=Faecalicatena contorta TaxID=39482 RepID=UPI001F4715A3|nr:amino acid ABC transporter permease [Faecalicatena contorta]
MSLFKDLDIKFMIETMPLLIRATRVTLYLAVIALIIAFCLALLLATIRYFRIKVLSQIVQFYVSFFRGTPLIVQLFIVYFGIFTLSPTLTRLPATVAAIVTLSLNSAAYMSETIRASFESVDSGQIEAAESLCMTRLQYMRRIVLPQAMRVALPSLFNSLIDLIKGTSIAFTIGVTEMMAMGIYEGSRQFNYFEIYFDIAIIYYVMSLILGYLQKKIEQKLSRY